MYDDDGRLLYTQPEPEFDDYDRDHLTALAEVKANECPKCGGRLDQTTDAEHYAWLATHDQCNRCEDVAYQQALADGMKEADALKHAAASARLWRASAIPPKKS